MVDPNTRQGKRTPVTLKIKFKSETLEQFIERYAVDVSQGGIFIRTKEPLAVGTQMRFEFQLRDASPLIAGEGTVVWTRENDPSRPAIAPGMGVRFDRLAEGSQTVLERILAEKAKQAPQRAPGETTKPPVFTDTPTRVAPAPVQEALLGDTGGARRESVSAEQTPLPKPMPFHSDAEDFDERAFDEATKVRSLDDLVAQSAQPEQGVAQPTAPIVTASAGVSEPVKAEPAEPATTSAPDGDAPFDRDSAPVLPSPPVVEATPAAKPRLLDTTPSPRADTTSTPPPVANDEPAKTKLGVEPARPASTTREPATKRPVAAADPGESTLPVQRSSNAPTLVIGLVVVAVAAAAIWFFFLRPKAVEENRTVATGSGSAGSAITPTDTPDAAPVADVGSGSADLGSGSQVAASGSGAGSAAVAPTAETVDTVIASTPDKATVEIVGTELKGPAPFTAKLEKDKEYEARITAPGFLASTVKVKGGAAKSTTKLAPKPKKIAVKTTPEGALVLIEGVAVASSLTPATVDVPKQHLTKKSLRVRISKKDFKPVDRVLAADAFKETDDAMTTELTVTLEKAPVVVRPPQGSGAGSAAAGSGAGTGSGDEGSSGGETPTPTPTPPADSGSAEPEPSL